MEKHYFNEQIFSDKYLYESAIDVLSLQRERMLSYLVYEINAQKLDHFTLEVDFHVERDGDYFLSKLIMMAVVTVPDME